MPSFCSYSSCGCCLWLNLINTISIQSLVITWYFPLNQGSFDQKSRLPWPFDPQTTNYLSLLEAGGIENQRTREPTVWVKSSDLMWQTSKSKLQHHDCPRRTNDTPVTHKTQAWILWLYNSKSNTYSTFRYWWRLSSSQRLNSSPADLFQSSAVTKKNAASVLNSRKSTCDLNPALLMGAAARCGRQPLRGRASPLHARSRNRRSKYTHLH